MRSLKQLSDEEISKANRIFLDDQFMDKPRFTKLCKHLCDTDALDLFQYKLTIYIDGTFDLIAEGV